MELGTEKLPRPSRFAHFRRNLIAGLLTLIPLWVTWFVLSLLFELLSDMGTPWVKAIARSTKEKSPTIAKWLLEPWVIQVFAAFLTLLGIYLLGVMASRVLGRQVLGLLEILISRIPFAQTIYGSTKKLIHSMQQDQTKLNRVVLIDFPSDSMRTLGFVTATLRDETTNEELAAVYVPTTPNPTSGYLEIVPASRLTPTQMTFDEAMSFIISGGAVAPETLAFFKGQDKPKT